MRKFTSCWTSIISSFIMNRRLFTRILVPLGCHSYPQTVVAYPGSSFSIRREFSIIGDTFSKMATNKMASDKDKKFATMLETMLSGEKWSLRPWKKTLEDQLNSWAAYIPGMRNSGEMKELGSFKELLDSLSDSELDDPDSIDGKAKERISQTSGKSIDDVNRLLLFYRQSQIVQQWLILKKSKGEILPRTEREMRAMQENDIRVRTISNKIMTAAKGGGAGKQQRRSGRGRGMPF